jgi:hypothetical protein
VQTRGICRAQPRLRITKSEMQTRISASISEGPIPVSRFHKHTNLSKWRPLIGLPFIPAVRVIGAAFAPESA